MDSGRLIQWFTTFEKRNLHGKIMVTHKDIFYFSMKEQVEFRFRKLCAGIFELFPVKYC